MFTMLGAASWGRYLSFSDEDPGTLVHKITQQHHYKAGMGTSMTTKQSCLVAPLLAAATAAGFLAWAEYGDLPRQSSEQWPQRFHRGAFSALDAA